MTPYFSRLTTEIGHTAKLSANYQPSLVSMWYVSIRAITHGYHYRLSAMIAINYKLEWQGSTYVFLDKCS